MIKWLCLLTYRESADKVVLHTGKYEELIVCSHEIAASTAQLVAASKVRKPAPKCRSVVSERFRLGARDQDEACFSVPMVFFLCGQVKADRHSKKLSVLQHASRNVNEMAANVVASTRTGQENLEDKGELG